MPNTSSLLHSKPSKNVICILVMQKEKYSQRGEATDLCWNFIQACFMQSPALSDLHRQLVTAELRRKEVTWEGASLLIPPSSRDPVFPGWFLQLSHSCCTPSSWPSEGTIELHSPSLGQGTSEITQEERKRKLRLKSQLLRLLSL